MPTEPELFVPASEVDRRAAVPNWLLVLARLYGVLGVIAIAIALWAGLASMPLGNLKAGLLPAALVALGWYAFGRLVVWVARPALSPREDRR